MLEPDVPVGALVSARRATQRHFVDQGASLLLRSQMRAATIASDPCRLAEDGMLPHSILTRELQLQQADWLRRMKTVASCKREKTSSGRLHLDLICWDAFVGVCDIPDAHRHPSVMHLWRDFQRQESCALGDIAALVVRTGATCCSDRWCHSGDAQRMYIGVTRSPADRWCPTIWRPGMPIPHHTAGYEVMHVIAICDARTTSVLERAAIEAARLYDSCGSGTLVANKGPGGERVRGPTPWFVYVCVGQLS